VHIVAAARLQLVVFAGHNMLVLNWSSVILQQSMSVTYQRQSLQVRTLSLSYIFYEMQQTASIPYTTTQQEVNVLKVENIDCQKYIYRPFCKHLVGVC